ncbi:MAG TPA: hypothetical protein VLF63_03540, partial [Patescibacteria group bacterium]|nr:hypothetical protein [Patescibacteria group bacterium]
MIDDVKPATKPSSGSDKQTKTDSIKLDNAVSTIKDEMSPLDSNSEHSNFNIDDLALDPKAKKETKEKEKPEPVKNETSNKKPQKLGGRKLRFKWPPSKKEWLSSLIIILICGTIIGFVINHIGHKPVVHAVKIAPKKPTPVKSNL